MCRQFHEIEAAFSNMFLADNFLIFHDTNSLSSIISLQAVESGKKEFKKKNERMMNVIGVEKSKSYNSKRRTSCEVENEVK